MLDKLKRLVKSSRFYSSRFAAIICILLIMLVAMLLTDSRSGLSVSLLWDAVYISSSENAVVALVTIVAIAAAGMIDVNWTQDKGSTTIGLRHKDSFHPESEFHDPKGEMKLEEIKNEDDEMVKDEQEGKKDPEEK